MNRDVLETEDRYRLLVEQLPAITYLVRVGESLLPGHESPTVFISPQVEDILGYRAEEWTGSPDLWMRILHPDDRDRVLNAVKMANRERRGFDLEYRTRHRNGHYIVIFNSARYLLGKDGQVYTEGLMYDMTWRKRYNLREKLTRECAESFRGISDLPAIGQWLRDNLGEVMPASNLMIALRDEASGLVAFPVAFDQADPPPAPRAPARYLVDYILDTGRGFHLNNSSHRSELAKAGYAPAGTPSSDWLGVPLKEANRVVGVLAVQTYNEGEHYLPADLHLLEELSVSMARRLCDMRAYNLLREGEDRHGALFDALPGLAVCGFDEEGRVRYWNKPAVRLFGYTREDMHNKTFWAHVIPEEGRDAMRAAIREMVKSRKPHPALDLAVVRKDGTRTTCASMFFYFEDEKGRPRMYVIWPDARDAGDVV